ncbi:hypothetical protein [Parafrankia sp. EUN1f]|uniref:hypothetical protein n=1 Tax=Parafrankia sp. EUN1f TaxID=102897 RepID=UPI0001C4675D|nr:hypothetical protein [Parafrankia sp. EUN1f]EFC82216.1 hypothetical protein FrEUN1fDRAFT_4673 [Parafrankia sp. EUN1f]
MVIVVIDIDGEEGDQVSSAEDEEVVVPGDLTAQHGEAAADHEDLGVFATKLRATPAGASRPVDRRRGR